jgi:hypothetical protein
MELIPQYVYFISKKETMEDLEEYRLKFIWMYGDNIPKEIKDAIEKRKIELTKNDNGRNTNSNSGKILD